MLSARALATFLACQDYPEKHLCPHLPPKSTDFPKKIVLPEPLDKPKAAQGAHAKTAQKVRKAVHFGEATIRKENNQTSKQPVVSSKTKEKPLPPSIPVALIKNDPRVSATEVKKDPKSFTQTLFDTTIFKALRSASFSDDFYIWGLWRREEADLQKDPADRKASDTRSSEPTNDLMVGQSELEPGNLDLIENGTTSSSRPPIRGNNILNNNLLVVNTDSIATVRGDIKVQTSLRAPNRQYHALLPSVSGLVPRHLLTTSRSPPVGLVRFISVRVPTVLSHFTHTNIKALAASVRTSQKDSVQRADYFLRSLGRPATLLPLTCRERYATQAEKNVNFANRSIVHVLSNIIPMLQSFRYCLLDSNPSAPFGEIACSMRRLFEIDYSRSNILPSLWISLGEIERYLCAQSRKDSDSGKSNDALKLNDPSFDHIMMIVIASLVTVVPAQRVEQWSAFIRFRRSGRGTPSGGRLPQSADLRAKVLQTMDIFEDEMALKVLKRLIKVIMMHCTRNSQRCKPQMDVLDRCIGFHNLGRNYCDCSSTTHSQSIMSQNDVAFNYILIEWLRTVLIKEWDGRAQVAKGGPVWGAAEMLSRLCM